MNKSTSVSTKDASKDTDKLEITVIPVDDEPYSKTITLSSTMISAVTGAPASTSAGTAANQLQYPSLKNIFQQKESLWKPIFGNYVAPGKQPLFSIFRKKITIKDDSKIQHPEGEEIGLHILFLKCDGNRFQRNAFANQLEVYCSTYFYGPLVIVYGQNSPPYKLHSFSTQYLIERIQPLNEEEQKIYPLPYSAKKCLTVRNLMADKRFSQDLDQHEKTMNIEEFMIYSYKTSFCPYINKKHEWSECNYAHRQQDFRRPPHFFFHYLEKCPNVSDDGSWDQCPDYLDCQYSHTLVEQLFSPLNYKLHICPDREPQNKFQCSKRQDLCCHNHSQEEKERAIKALRNPPKILPEHESMQDYIDIIDQEGLLLIGETKEETKTNEEKPAINRPTQTQQQQAAQPTTTPAAVVKKVVLAKLPEENKDGWLALEHTMNKESLQKKDKDVGELKKSESVNVGYQGTPMSQVSLAQMVVDMSPFSDDGVAFAPPITQFTQMPLKAESVQPISNEDYVQEFMKATGNKSLFQPVMTQAEQIKVLKGQERKSKKKGKKAIKVSEFKKEGTESRRSASKDSAGSARSDNAQLTNLQSDLSQKQEVQSDDDKSSIVQFENKHTFPKDETNSDPDYSMSEKSDRVHKKTQMQSKIFEVDLQKVKSILEEDIVNTIYRTCEEPNQTKNQVKNMKKPQGPSIIKSTAGTLLKQKIENKGDEIIKTAQKFQEQSRFCYLQSSSSSSSEKDLALGQMGKKLQQKQPTNLDTKVPEEPVEDQKSHGDIEVEKVNVKLENKTEEEDFSNSLFTFNFLNEDKPSAPVKAQTATKPTAESVPPINFMGGQQDDGLNSNFHNFFTNDRIFGSPSPNQGLFQQNFSGHSGSQIKVQNHFNSHTTINNYDFNAQKFYNLGQANFDMSKKEGQGEQPENHEEIWKYLQSMLTLQNQNKNNVNNYINKNYFVVINQCPPSTAQQQPQVPVFNTNNQSPQTHQNATPGKQHSSTSAGSSGSQPFFAAYNQQMAAQQNIFNLFPGQSANSSAPPGGWTTQNLMQGQFPSQQTQRSQGANSNQSAESFDSTGNPENNEATKEVVMEMYNNVMEPHSAEMMKNARAQQMKKGVKPQANFSYQQKQQMQMPLARGTRKQSDSIPTSKQYQPKQ